MILSLRNLAQVIRSVQTEPRASASGRSLTVAALISLIVFSCAGTSADRDQIDGPRVIRHVEKIVSYGPHPPGSEAQQKVGNYLETQLEAFGLEVHKHAFTPVTPIGPLAMNNIWGVVKGKQDRVILLASHYDSKYFPDFRFVGANDSGSSSALLLEVARVLSAKNPTEYTLWFAFFDGEEAIREWTSADSLYGSREFVKMLKGRNELQKVAALILLDMIGEKDLLIRKDFNSSDWLKDIVWNKAAAMGHQEIFSPYGDIGAVDDHLPFAEQGIPVVDVIDLDYTYWHRPEDTVDKLSAENLKIVGNVVLASLPAIAERLRASRP